MFSRRVFGTANLRTKQRSPYKAHRFKAISKFRRRATALARFGGAIMEKRKPNRSKTTEMKLGRIVYTVVTHFKENAKETAEDMLFQHVTESVSAKLKLAENAVN
jgi:hypothetical protein